MTNTETDMPEDIDGDISYQTRLKILAAALPIAAFEGWTSKTLRSAVKACKLPKGAEQIYFPGGPIELISFWGEDSNRQAETALSKLDLSKIKIRERVTAGVIARLETIGDNSEAARRALAKFSMPSSGTAGPKSLWAAADTIWRAIGDTSTDANFYSKRTVLSAVISSSLVAWLNDNSDDKAEARAFLDRRIENVMQFEKFKFKARKAREKWPDPIKAMAGLRYGSRRRRRR
jgi:ubiquinone biosynthesis protein COQ9